MATTLLKTIEGIAAKEVGNLQKGRILPHKKSGAPKRSGYRF
ncbi:hypothetical protein [Mucilaginibacter gynuensis]